MNECIVLAKFKTGKKGRKLASYNLHKQVDIKQVEKCQNSATRMLRSRHFEGLLLVVYWRFHNRSGSWALCPAGRSGFIGQGVFWSISGSVSPLSSHLLWRLWVKSNIPKAFHAKNNRKATLLNEILLPFCAPSISLIVALKESSSVYSSLVFAGFINLFFVIHVPWASQ